MRPIPNTSVTGYTMGVTDDIGTTEITGAITNGLSADLSFPNKNFEHLNVSQNKFCKIHLRQVKSETS